MPHVKWCTEEFSYKIVANKNLISKVITVCSKVSGLLCNPDSEKEIAQYNYYNNNNKQQQTTKTFIKMCLGYLALLLIGDTHTKEIINVKINKYTYILLKKLVSKY